jgi:tetratricopeptide (TPR) repeat protein
MKVLIRISVLLITVLSFTIVSCQGQKVTEQAEKSYTKGVEHAVLGNFKDAKEEFEKALTVDPFFETAKNYSRLVDDVNRQEIKAKTAIIFFKGVDLNLKRKWVDAIDEFNKALEINPKLATTFIYRGNAYANKGQSDKAISDFTKAIKINPKYVKAYFRRSGVYFKKGQYDKAIADLNKAVEINPKYDKAYISRAFTYAEGKGQYDKAIFDYTRAIEINPKLAGAYISRGLIYMERWGNKIKACSDWKQACELGLCEFYEFAEQSGDCE